MYSSPDRASPAAHKSFSQVSDFDEDFFSINLASLKISPEKPGLCCVTSRDSVASREDVDEGQQNSTSSTSFPSPSPSGCLSSRYNDQSSPMTPAAPTHLKFASWPRIARDDDTRGGPWESASTPVGPGKLSALSNPYFSWKRVDHSREVTPHASPASKRCMKRMKSTTG